MAELNLEPGEYVITTIDNVTVNQGMSTCDLVLTNWHLMMASKTLFMGRTKSVMKHRLDTISVMNGRAQVKIEKTGGIRQLLIQLKTGEKLTITSAQKEDFTGFVSQINLLLTGTAAAPVVESNDPLDHLAESFQNVFSIFGGRNDSVQQQQPVQAPYEVSSKCAGCHAPISGYTGQVVTCGYCDLEQRL